MANTPIRSVETFDGIISLDSYTKEQTLSDDVKASLGLETTATPSDAFKHIFENSSGGEVDYNSLINRPFGLNGTGSIINWDGNIEGLYTPGYDYYKVSDEVINPDDLINMRVTIYDDGEERSSVVEEDDFDIGEGYAVSWDHGIICVYEPCIIEDIEFAEPGIYFESWSGHYVMYLSNFEGTIKTLDPMYLPNTRKYQSDWQSVDPSDPGFIKNRPFGPEVTERLVIVDGHGTAFWDALNIYATYLVTWGNEYADNVTIYRDSDTGICSFDFGSLDLYPDIESTTSVDLLNNGTLDGEVEFTSEYTDTIKIYEITKVKKLDRNHISDSVLSWDGIGSRPSPFGTLYRDTYIALGSSPTHIEAYLSMESEYTVSWDYTMYERLVPYTTSSGVVCLGNRTLAPNLETYGIDVDLDTSIDTGEPFFMINDNDNCNLIIITNKFASSDLVIYQHDNGTIEFTIPEKYIPQTIATKEYVDSAISSNTPDVVDSYTKEEALSSTLKTSLGLSNNATPSDALDIINRKAESGGNENVYTKNEILSDTVKETLGLGEDAAPSDAFTAIINHTHTAEEIGAAPADHTHDVSDIGAAPVENAALTGVPTAPTAAEGTNTQQIATTAFVQTALSNSATKNHANDHAVNGTDPITPEMIGADAFKVTFRYEGADYISDKSFDEIIGAFTQGRYVYGYHINETPDAPNIIYTLNDVYDTKVIFYSSSIDKNWVDGNPTMSSSTLIVDRSGVTYGDWVFNVDTYNGGTIMGVVNAPTADPGTNTDQIATTAFVQNAISKAIGDVIGGSY